MHGSPANTATILIDPSRVARLTHEAPMAIRTTSGSQTLESLCGPSAHRARLLGKEPKLALQGRPAEPRNFVSQLAQLVGTHLSEPGYTDLTYVRIHPGFPDIWVYPWLGFRACEELLHNIHAGVQALLDPAAPPVRLLQLPKFTSFLGPGEPPADEHLFISVAVAAIMSQAAIKDNTTVLVLTPVYTVHNLDAAVEHNMISCSMTDTEGNQMLCYATDGTSMFFLLAEEGDAMRIAEAWKGTIHINNTDVVRVTLMASIWTTSPLADRDTAEQYLVLEHPQCRAHMGGPGVQPLHMPRPIPFMPCTSGIPTKWTVDTLGSLNGRDPVPYFCPTYRLGPNSDCLSLFRIVPPAAATSAVQLTDLFVANIVTACLGGGGETATPPPPPPKPAKIVRARLTVSSDEKPPKKVAAAPPVVAAKKPPATKATAKRKDPAPAEAAAPKKGVGAAKAPTVKKRPTVTTKPKVVVVATAAEPTVVAAVAEPVVVAPAPVDPTPPDNQMWFAFAQASTTIGYRSITDLQPGDGSRISSSRASYAQDYIGRRCLKPGGEYQTVLVFPVPANHKDNAPKPFKPSLEEVKAEYGRELVYYEFRGGPNVAPVVV